MISKTIGYRGALFSDKPMLSIFGGCSQPWKYDELWRWWRVIPTFSIIGPTIPKDCHRSSKKPFSHPQVIAKSWEIPHWNMVFRCYYQYQWTRNRDWHAHLVRICLDPCCGQLWDDQTELTMMFWPWHMCKWQNPSPSYRFWAGFLRVAIKMGLRIHFKWLGMQQRTLKTTEFSSGVRTDWLYKCHSDK